MTEDPTQTFSDILQSQGTEPAAQWLVDHYRAQEDAAAELFEALKMQTRLRLGLPAVPLEGQTEELDPQTDAALERGLIDACREVGTRLLRRGRLEEGWMYMRAVHDPRAAAEALRPVPVTDENLDTMLALLVQEGVDPGRGTVESLHRRGVCNTITMLDSVVAMRGRGDQQAAVGALVRHVHAEVIANVRSDLATRQPPVAGGDSLAEILEQHPNLLQGGAYHLDTTHIASTVRFARVLDDPADLRLALDLAIYGRYLHSQYQYSSEEPFEPLYATSIAFFRVLLGERVDAGLQLFLQKAEDLPVEQVGTVAIETYVDLLARIGRYREALNQLLRRMPPGMRPIGLAPSVLELSRLAGDFQPMLERCGRINDMIGYAAASFQANK